MKISKNTLPKKKISHHEECYFNILPTRNPSSLPLKPLNFKVVFRLTSSGPLNISWRWTACHSYSGGAGKIPFGRISTKQEHARKPFFLSLVDRPRTFPITEAVGFDSNFCRVFIFNWILNAIWLVAIIAIQDVVLLNELLIFSYEIDMIEGVL